MSEERGSWTRSALVFVFGFVVDLFEFICLFFVYLYICLLCFFVLFV
jgi:hypothetical protein